jgi:hypothetical protein
MYLQDLIIDGRLLLLSKIVRERKRGFLIFLGGQNIWILRPKSGGLRTYASSIFSPDGHSNASREFGFPEVILHKEG